MGAIMNTGNNNQQVVDDVTFERWKLVLRSKRCYLNDSIKPTLRLFNKLEEQGVINKYMKDQILVCGTDYDKNSALLDYLHTRPKQDFLSFREALVYENQASILEIFERFNAT